MGATPATHRPVCASLCTVLFALGACSAPVARPPAEVVPPVEAPSAEARPGELSPSTADAFQWPDSGWLRLDVDVFVALDTAVDTSATAMLAARWEPGDVEVWIDAPDPDELGARATVHRRALGAAADETMRGLRGTFEAGLADGLESSIDPRLEAWVFAATGREHDTTVAQRWRIGEGAAPWGPDGPFSPSS